MIARAGTGWQTTLADLSLILFLVTAAGVSEAPVFRPARSEVAPALPALGDPVAVWSEVPGGPTLAQWLSSQPRDPRQRLTLVAPSATFAHAQAIAASAGRPVRLVLEPEHDRPIYAALTYDQPPQVAQALLGQGR